MGVQEDKKEQEAERIFEEMLVGIFPNLIIDMSTNSQEAQQIPRRRHSKRAILRHTIIKLSKMKTGF